MNECKFRVISRRVQKCAIVNRPFRKRAPQKINEDMFTFRARAQVPGYRSCVHFSFEMLLCTSWLHFSLTDAIVKRERCGIGTGSELTENAPRTQEPGAHSNTRGFTIPAIFARALGLMGSKQCHVLFRGGGGGGEANKR